MMSSTRRTIIQALKAGAHIERDKEASMFRVQRLWDLPGEGQRVQRGTLERMKAAGLLTWDFKLPPEPGNSSRLDADPPSG